MRCIFFFTLITLFLGSVVNAQTYKQIHESAIVADTHNDIISVCVESGYKFDSNLEGKTHTDLERMFKGGLDVQVFSIFCDGKQKNPFQFANRQIDTLYAWVARNPAKMMLVKTPEELKTAVQQKKIASMIGVDGGHMIEDDLSKLDKLYDRGTRYLTLTWNNNNSWATSAEYESGSQRKNGVVDSTSQKKGLSDFGKKVVKRMNELGMMIDVSHVGEQTFWDAMAITTKPLIASHSNAYSLAPVYRNLKDDQIKAIAKNGGVIQLNFYAAFLDSSVGRKIASLKKRQNAEKKALRDAGKKTEADGPALAKKHAKQMDDLRVPFSLLFDHMEYIIKIAGIDHVGLGGDFDGITVTPLEIT
ncbi:MAG: dipeptidase, partial [Ginsengibacter sp.]